MQTNYFQKHASDQLITRLPGHAPGLIITVPACGEADLLATLQSLHSCDVPHVPTEVLVLINQSENASDLLNDMNTWSFQRTQQWAAKHSLDHLQFHVLRKLHLPAKKAGVGLARKILMDEAARRLYRSGRSNGVIAGLDADCRVSANYLEALWDAFDNSQTMTGCSIHFEHPYADLPHAHANAIMDYELHLRYFIEAQRWAGHPFAYQTIGSAMAVRADTYVAVGGMNTRKAGEDFYFLQKIIERGGFKDLNTCTVYPSARKSDRVPFGTGKAVSDLLSREDGLTTYHYLTFQELKSGIDLVPRLCAAQNSDVDLVIQQFPEALQEFMINNSVVDKLMEIRNHTASHRARVKRFYRWFNAFRVLKFVHFSRDHYYPNIPVLEAAVWLSRQLGILIPDNRESAILAFRERAKLSSPSAEQV